MGEVAVQRALGSAALDLAWTAAGRFDAYWERGIEPWDMAAGILIAREAGAIVSDASGGDRMFESGSVLAGNPNVHKGLLAVLDGAKG
jgi:myo-inositol-1(or 4)-monophosphatase